MGNATNQKKARTRKLSELFSLDNNRLFLNIFSQFPPENVKK